VVIEMNCSASVFGIGSSSSLKLITKDDN
jgi:hypothetical protein